MRTRTPFRFALPIVALALALASCSDDAEETAGPSAGAGGGGNKGGSGGSSASGGAGAGGTGAGVNIGGGGASGSGAGGTAGKGCEKIDFLFIVDNSVSMQNEQDQLVAAFPKFIQTIESTVNAASNYHVMVTDTDAWGRCDTANPWTGMNPTSTTCNTYIKTTTFAECDRTWGAGVIHPAGQYASNKICPVPDGRRYLQQGDPNVATTFACMAKVGVAGHPSERPMDSLLAALSPAINATGGCNAGFLRDDALLVVTFISDDPNWEDTGKPLDWYNAVVAAKKGDNKAVSMVGFTPAWAGCGGTGTPKGSHWAEFIAMFPFNLHANVCGTDYGAEFDKAVKVIDESCDQYVPPIK